MRRAAVAVVAAALIIRVALVAATPHYVPLTDSADYDRHAVSLATDHVYPPTILAPGGGPSAFRPPAFPMLLGGLYAVAGTDSPADRWRAGRVLEALLGALVVALIILIARRLWTPRVALIAGAIAAVYPPLILVGSSLMSEPLFIALLLGALLAALLAREGSRRWAVLAGALIGLAALTRSNGAIVALPLCALLWRGPSRFAPVAVLVAATLVLVPWTVRNATTLHAFVPVSTQGGYALSGVYNAEARSQQPWRAYWIPAEFAQTLRPIFDDTSLDEPAWSGRLRDAAVDYARDHPAYIAEVGFWNTLRLLNLQGPGPEVRLAAAEAYPEWLTRLSVYAFWLLGALALAGALTAAARRAPRAMWAIPALIALSCVFIEGLTRYRSPVDPFLILLAALAVDRSLASRR